MILRTQTILSQKTKVSKGNLGFLLRCLKMNNVEIGSTDLKFIKSRVIALASDPKSSPCKF